VKNRYLVLVSILVVILLSSLGFLAYRSLFIPERETLTFVFHPGESVELEVLKKNFGPIFDALSMELDMDYDVKLGSSYAATMESLRNGTADVSRIGSSMYVLTRDEIDLRLVAWDIIDGEDHYHAVLLGRPGIWEEPFTFEQLKGKTVAFVDPSSTSGYIAPVTAMLDAGITLEDLDKYSFGTTHPVAVEAMLNGVADVACTGDALIPEIENSGSLEGEDFILLWESPPLVMDVWVIGPGVDTEKADRIAEALLGLPDEIFDGCWIDGFSPVDLSAYEFSEKMLRAVGEIE